VKTLIRSATERMLSRVLPQVTASACANPRAGDCCSSWGVWTCDYRCKSSTLC